MKITLMAMSGIRESLVGVSLYRGSNLDTANVTALKLLKTGLNSGEQKFLESIIVHLCITAPRYWWQQADTYRIGITKQSGSTMNSIMKRHLVQSDFDDEIDEGVLDILNSFIDDKNLRKVKAHLPESYLQTRVVCTSMKTLLYIVSQRRTHRLEQWTEFCKFIEDIPMSILIEKLESNDRSNYEGVLDEA